PYADAAGASKERGSKVASTRCRRARRLAGTSGAPVAAGPAASPARVITEIATSRGSDWTVTRSRSITTEVSTSPRACRRSGTRARILVDQGIEVPSQTASSEPRSAGEGRNGGAGGHETPASRRHQLPNCHAIPGDQEALAAVERSHHFPAVVAQLPLGDLARHGDRS